MTTTYAMQHDADQQVWAVVDQDGDVHEEYVTRGEALAELTRLADEKIAEELRATIEAKLPDLDLETLGKMAALLM